MHLKKLNFFSFIQKIILINSFLLDLYLQFNDFNAKISLLLTNLNYIRSLICIDMYYYNVYLQKLSNTHNLELNLYFLISGILLPHLSPSLKDFLVYESFFSFKCSFLLHIHPLFDFQKSHDLVVIYHHGSW